MPYWNSNKRYANQGKIELEDFLGKFATEVKREMMKDQLLWNDKAITPKIEPEFWGSDLTLYFNLFSPEYEWEVGEAVYECQQGGIDPDDGFLEQIEATYSMGRMESLDFISSKYGRVVQRAGLDQSEIEYHLFVIFDPHVVNVDKSKLREYEEILRRV